MKIRTFALLGIIGLIFSSLSLESLADEFAWEKARLSQAERIEVQDDSSQLESEEEESDEGEFLYDFQILFGLDYSNRFLLGDNSNEFQPALALTLDFEYYNFFMESGRKNRASAVLGRAYLGYHLWSDENNAVDIISGTYVGGIERDDGDGDPIPELVNLKNRKADNSFGARYSYFDESYYFSTELVRDVFELSHKGWIVDSYIGGLSTVGNWDFGYGVGHTWYSSNTSSYYLGVEPEELTPALTTYTSGPSYSFNLEFSTRYPLSENWVFESGISYLWFSKNISDSPLFTDHQVLETFVGFGYVF